VENRPVRQIIMLAACLLGGPVPASAQDEIDIMLDHGQVPSDLRHAHGYSDFTDPLGRFMDLVAAGDIAQARAIKPDACAVWLATRQTSALTGKFWAWNTEISLDTLCAHH
jgi:hypothetical protein